MPLAKCIPCQTLAVQGCSACSELRREQEEAAYPKITSNARDMVWVAYTFPKGVLCARMIAQDGACYKINAGSTVRTYKKDQWLGSRWHRCEPNEVPEHFWRQVSGALFHMDQDSHRIQLMAGCDKEGSP